MTVIIIVMFIYANIKYKRNDKINKVKLRYGTIISSIIMALPCTLVLEPPFIVDKLEEIFRLNSECMYLILAVITAILFLAIIKFIYVPIDKNKE